MSATMTWNRAGSGWTGLVQTNAVVEFLDTLLRGAGQVMFQNNPLTGLLFLVGIFYNSPLLGAAGLVGLASSTLAALLLGVDRGLVRNGLFGFNGILVGIGLAFFLRFDPLLVAYIVVGAVLSTIVMMALANFFSPWDMPALTAPFVLTAWLFLFAAYQFAYVRPSDLIAPVALDPKATTQTELRALPTGGQVAGLTAGSLVESFLRGVGEVMFQDNAVTGAIFLLAILVNSRISGLFAALGSATGLLTALALGGNGFWIYHGLYGFNAVLCAIAVGGLFYVLTWKSAVYALLAAVVGTILTASIAVFLSPLGMPALTAPFVLTTWLFVLPKGGFRVLSPVALAEVSTAEHIRATQLTKQAAASTATAAAGAH